MAGENQPLNNIVNIVQPIFGSPQIFDPAEVSISGWYEMFEEFYTTNGVLPEPDPVDGVVAHNQRRSLVLSSIGSRAYELLRTKCLPGRANAKTIDELMVILRGKYEPPGMVSAHCYTFNKRVQKDRESAADYISTLQELASRCNFHEFPNVALKNQLIAGIRNNDTRRKFLGRADQTYAQATEIVLQDEAVSLQSKILAQNVHVNAIHARPSDFKSPKKPPFHAKGNPPQRHQKQPSSQSTPPSEQWKPCHRCGRRHNCKTCPAVNWTCHHCVKLGHGARVCNSRRIHNVDSTSPEQSNDSCQDDITQEVNQLLAIRATYQCPISVSVLPEPGLVTPEVPIICDSSSKYISSPTVSSITDFNDSQSDSPKESISDTSVTCISNSKDSESHCSSATGQARELNSSVPVQNFSLVNKVEHNSPLIVTVTVESTTVDMEIDTGAAISLISKKQFIHCFPNVQIKATQCTLKSVTGEIQVAGEAMVNVVWSNQTFLLPIIICNLVPAFTPLLGRSWLDAIMPDWRTNVFCMPVPAVNISHSEVPPPSVEQLKQLFPRVFDTQADTCIEGFTARLVLKEGAVPVFARPYPLAFAVIDPVNAWLDKLEIDGKAVRVRQSEWASPGVVVHKKDGGIRYCVDFKRTVNPNLRVDYYPLPRPDDVFATLANGSVFVSLDLTDAYTQLALHPDSQELCVVNTHRGLYKLTRLIYGVASAAAIFQNVMDKILANIPGVVCYIDNILVKGSSMSECIERTLLVLSRLEQYNVRLRLDKCEWFANKIEYLGFVISKEGRSPSPALVNTITNAKTPSNAKEVRSFLGLVNFFADFVPSLSTVAKPLRQLTETNVHFLWSDVCEKAFQVCKQLLQSEQLLMHYNPELPIVVHSDASPVGVGAVLYHIVTHNGKTCEKPVLFASSSLTPAQQNYAQIDREALGLIFAVTKFHKYLWGREFTLVTDNSAIERIFHPDKGLPTRTGQRFQHWAIILQAYSYKLVHRRSERLAVADAFSRLPPSAVIEDVHYIKMLDGFPITPDLISEESTKDPVLSRVLVITHEGWPSHKNFKDDPAIKPYFQVRDNLTIHSRCLMFGARVVIPASLKKEVLSLLHQNHPGVVRSKLLARSVVWWPTLNSDIETLCAQCHTCAKVNFKASPELMPWPRAMFAFQRVHIDFFQYKQVSYFIFCYAFSRWLHIEHMDRTTAIVMFSLWLFAIFGFPEDLVSDNGPPL